MAFKYYKSCVLFFLLYHCHIITFECNILMSIRTFTIYITTCHYLHYLFIPFIMHIDFEFSFSIL